MIAQLIVSLGFSFLATINDARQMPAKMHRLAISLSVIIGAKPVNRSKFVGELAAAVVIAGEPHKDRCQKPKNSNLPSIVSSTGGSDKMRRLSEV